MRMWMVPTQCLCRQHLLGEHSEIHKHRHNFEKGHSIAGRISPVVTVEPASMEKRHDELVNEMLERGYNHKSPYSQPDLSKYPGIEDVHVDVNLSLDELSRRCPACAERIALFRSAQ